MSDPSQAPKVFKFGGASVRDAEAIRNVGRILQATAHRPLAVVISAMGKTTNALEGIIRAHYDSHESLASRVNDLVTYHDEITRELLGPDAASTLESLSELWVQLQWVLEDDPHYNYDYEYDQVIVFGELASTRIVSGYLRQAGLEHVWLDARELIKTDDAYREARVDWKATQAAIDRILVPALSASGLVITQGFIGSTAYNESTSLGREGSDFTAAILANALDATDVTVWKDVPGIMTADPKRFEKVVRLPEISYREAIEMTYFGAKVIHPKTIKPLQNKGIPMLVKPFDAPDQPGTSITSEESGFLPPIVVVESEQALLQIATKDYSFVAENHLSEIFSRLADLRIKVNTMRNTAVSFIVCVRNEPEKLARLMEALNPSFIVTLTENLELITVRHANQTILEQLQKGQEIFFEEKFGDTDQFVLRRG